MKSETWTNLLLVQNPAKERTGSGDLILKTLFYPKSTQACAGHVRIAHIRIYPLNTLIKEATKIVLVHAQGNITTVHILKGLQ